MVLQDAAGRTDLPDEDGELERRCEHHPGAGPAPWNGAPGQVRTLVGTAPVHTLTDATKKTIDTPVVIYNEKEAKAYFGAETTGAPFSFDEDTLAMDIKPAK